MRTPEPPETESPASAPRLPVAVMVSGQGRGTNLQALLDAASAADFPARIAVVIGTREGAPALERARQAGVRAVVVSPRKYAGDEAGYAAALLRILQRDQVGLICLAGYMRKLPPEVVAAYAGRIMNVHAALLPAFGGQGMYGGNVHQAVLASGAKVSGCTVHFVDEHYDTGPIIVQIPVSVYDEDTPESLAARILPEEHRAYARAVRLFAEGRLRIEGRRVLTGERAETGG